MPLYMDRHDLQGVTPADVAAAHVSDLEIQDKYGVRYITYWFDPNDQTVFCLCEAPNAEAAQLVHRESHGLIPNRIIEVDTRRVEEFLGKIEEPSPGEPWAESALRTILFTDMEGSTALTQKLGDDMAMEVLRTHDRIAQDAISSHRGRSIKHTGDGIMACFPSVVRGLRCAIAIQQGLEELSGQGYEPRIRVRIGLSAGEPVTENDDLFGTSVQLAARICAACDPDAILAASVVRELSAGKGFDWEDQGETVLRGFEEPVRLFALRWPRR